MRALVGLVLIGSLASAQDFDASPLEEESPIAVARRSFERAIEAARYLDRAERRDHLVAWDQGYAAKMRELAPADQVHGCLAVFRRGSCDARERCAAMLGPHFVLRERRRLQSADEPLRARWDDLVALRVIADRARDTHGSCRGQPSPFDDARRREIGRRESNGRDALEVAREGVPTMEISTPYVDVPRRRVQVPPRQEIIRVMNMRVEAVTNCMPADSTAVGHIVFANDGSVRTVEVRGSLAGTPAAACMEEKLREIRIMPFEREDFRVTYPFRR